jgi:hypothetical protein
MKVFALITSLFVLTACSNVDHHVRLVGEFNDHKQEVRYEVYVRAVDIGESSRLKHKEEPPFLTDLETRGFLKRLQDEEYEQSLSKLAPENDAKIDRGCFPKEK